MAVVLSSALIAAVSCAMASVHAGIRARVEATVGASDVRITKAGKDLFPVSVLEAAAAWPETALAAGRLRDTLPLENPANGKHTATIANGILPAIEGRVRPHRFVAGRMPSTDGEIALDEAAAAALGAGVGDAVRVREPVNPLTGLAERVGGKLGEALRQGVKRAGGAGGPELRVVGITAQPAIGVGIQLRPESMLTLEGLGGLTGRRGVIGEVDVVLRDAGRAEAVAAAHRDAFGAGISVGPSSKVTSGLDQNIRQSQIGMTIASMLSYLAAAFIIMTGLTTSVTEKQRELAMVRCIGGTRWQMAEGQLVTGLIVGALGAAVGVPLGMLGAYVMVRLFPEQLPAGFAVNPPGLGLAVAGSVLAGLVGAAWPAVRAARTTPLEALAVRSRGPRASGILACLGAGLALACVHLGIIYLPRDADVLFWTDVTVGLPLMFLGYFLLSVPALWVVTRAAGPVVGRALGVPGGVLTRTVLATPYRFGFTSGAMMMGLALLVAIWTNGRSVVEDWLKGLRFPDAFVAGVAITDSTRSRIEALPFVTDTVAIQVLPMQTDAFGLKAFDHTKTSFIAFEPGPFFRMTTLQWVEGTPESAIPRLERGGAVLVAREFRNAKGIGVGDRLVLRYEDRPYEFEVAGVVSSPGLDIVNQWFEIGEDYADQAVNAVFGTRADMERLFGVSSYRLLQVGLGDDAGGRKITDDEALARIREAAGPGILDAGSGRQILGEIRGFLEGSLRIFSLVAVAAMLVACFGVSNLIVAGVQARQFEFGVLRAIGAPRGLLSRLVLGEAVLIALTACLLGTVMGVHGAKAGQRVNELIIGIRLTGWPRPGPVLAGWATVAVITVGAALPTIVSVGRRPVRELLGAVRG